MYVLTLSVLIITKSAPTAITSLSSQVLQIGFGSTEFKVKLPAILDKVPVKVNGTCKVIVYVTVEPLDNNGMVLNNPIFVPLDPLLPVHENKVIPVGIELNIFRLVASFGPLLVTVKV